MVEVGSRVNSGVNSGVESGVKPGVEFEAGVSAEIWDWN